MLTKKILLVILLSLPLISSFSSVYYVAVTGSDSNDGSWQNPFATIQRAQDAVIAGDTVYIRGGSYVMTESVIAKYYNIWAYVTYLNKSGAAGLRIKYWAYPGEHPKFDYSNIKPSGYRVHAFQVTGSYIHIKGLEVTGVQVTITTHTQSECFHNEGSNNIYEQLSMHDGQAIGFYLTKGSNNLVLNCDAYNNWDYTSETGKGENSDGFGFHPAKGSTGNVIKGCRAWFNSDDGYDCISANESVTFDSCWAFYNGYSTSWKSLSNGNGFKVGGYGQAPTVSELPNPIPANTVRFCMAYRNKSNGFYANHHVTTGSYWYNNTAYRNATNYNMLSQRITTSSKTGADTTLDCPGLSHVLHNNISFKYSAYKDTLNIGAGCNISTNTFSPSSGVTVESTDFMSTDEQLLIAARQSNGNLPENGFLRLKNGSDLIDKGANLGFTYNGSAPDFGAFEIKTNQTITFDSIPAKKYSDNTVQLNATASSGLSISYISSNPDIVQIKGVNAVIKGIGTATITASQYGNINYYAAPEIRRTFVVLKDDQTINFDALPTDKSFGGSPFKLSATSSSGKEITFSSSDTSVVKIKGDSAFIVNAGPVTITASVSGSDIYNANSAEQTMTVSKASQIITFDALIEKTMGDPDFLLQASATSLLPVSFSCSDESIATVSNSWVTLVNAGQTTITAIQEGNANYLPAASVSQPLMVNAAPVTGTIETFGKSLLLYPNPAYSDMLEIKIPQTGFGQVVISIMSEQGKTVYQTITKASFNDKIKLQIDISALPKGIYIVTTTSEDGCFTSKLIRL
jgi:hypothetical protein